MLHCTLFRPLQHARVTWTHLAWSFNRCVASPPSCHRSSWQPTSPRHPSPLMAFPSSSTAASSSSSGTTLTGTLTPSSSPRSPKLRPYRFWILLFRNKDSSAVYKTWAIIYLNLTCNKILFKLTLSRDSNPWPFFQSGTPWILFQQFLDLFCHS